MPDLSPTIDGRGLKLGSTWANTTGDGVDATSINTATKFWNGGINAIDVSAFGSTQVERYFVEFDTSEIEAEPQDATFKLFGKNADSADVICVQASFASAGALVVGDWDSWNESSPVDYTDEITSWDDGDYNEFTITAAGLAAMVSLDEFQMICLEADNDYTQVSSNNAGLSLSAGYYTRLADDDANQPVLSYTAAAVAAEPRAVKVLSGHLTVKSGQFIIN